MNQEASKKRPAAIQYGESGPRNLIASVETGTATSRVTITVLVKTEVAVISSSEPTMNGIEAASAGAKTWPTAANRKVRTSSENIRNLSASWEATWANQINRKSRFPRTVPKPGGRGRMISRGSL